MVRHQIRVDRSIYVFDVPASESSDFPKKKVFSAFEPSYSNGDLTADNTTLMTKYWDYKNGRHGLNKDGTLVFSFRVRAFSGGFRFDPLRVDLLKNYIRNELVIAYKNLNESYEKGGHENMIVIVPEKIEELSVSGKNSLHYKLSGSIDFDAYVIPMSEQFYVQIQFDYIDNSRGQGMQWRQKAKLDADAIFSSMKIAESVN